MIVVDTNVIGYLYLESKHSLQAEQALRKSAEWAAPPLWRSEFRNVLALYLRKRLLTLDYCDQIMRSAVELMAPYEYEVASEEVLQLVAGSTCSAYDCEFVALAQELGTVLVTMDKQILKDFPMLTTSLGRYVESET